MVITITGTSSSQDKSHNNLNPISKRKPSVLKATKGQSIPLWKEKHLSQGCGRLLVKIKKETGQVSQDPLPSNAA